MTKSNKLINTYSCQRFAQSKLMIFGLVIMLAAVMRVYADGYFQVCGSTDDSPGGSCSADNNQSCTITENPLGSCQYTIYLYYCISGNEGADRLNISHGSCSAHEGYYVCDIDPNQPITHSNGTANCVSSFYVS